ncbi:MAG: carboxyl transferase domain-containing protein [Syntrophales bacterium]
MASDKISELNKIRDQIEQGGGEPKINKQHKSGKLTARERINLLLDEGTFVELDAFVKHRCTEFGMGPVVAPGEGIVTGYGQINGRVVYVFAQDFTVIGGTLGEMHAKKICKVMDLALRMGAPVIGIEDSGGARIQEGVDALSGYGHIFYRNTISSGVIPQISVIMGPCAGGAVYSPALTDFIFMVDKIGQMFITGPQVIKEVLGQTVSPQELGGAMVHNRTSGVAHFLSPDEATCIRDIRKLLSFFPSSNRETPPVVKFEGDVNIRVEALNNIVPDNPRKPYDMKKVISAIVDHGDFLETQTHYAQNIITAFARLNGASVGIIANQPRILAGCLDINASDKASRFIRTCDAFNIPLLTLSDVPGYLPGTNQEFGGIIRHGAKMLYAYSEATVPKVTVVIRKAYGGAYLAMCGRELGADMVFAWPGAEIAVMGPEGAANIIFKKDIESAADPVQARAEKIQEYRTKLATPYITASRGYIDDVMEPAVTRSRLISAFAMLAGKRETKPAKKHGIFPV